MGVTGEAALRALLARAGPPSRSQTAHIREAMVRWRGCAAARAALAQQLEAASAAEREAYQYLTGCLLAMQPDAPIGVPLAPAGAALPAAPRALPRPRKAPRGG